MKVLAIIPARYASTRFPGKPLAMIGNKPMIQHVYERVADSGAADETLVATDDERIADAVENFGGKVLLTIHKHNSGTDRCGEVLERMDEEYDVVINVQGDEPFVDAEQLTTLAKVFQNPKAQIATLMKKIEDLETLMDRNVVKVVCDKGGRALFFSRQPLPYLRGADERDWLAKHAYYKHVGIYAFRSSTLAQVVQMPQGVLERCESLEQLRWLENGIPIEVRETTADSFSVDTPEDLKKILELKASRKK
ncbi:MAG: 3-deoxy-manno-octulosonate cytidylyltransferase [Bacteroidales bacterium]|nr:3-deoxy-manno-octulosonate cytidylyltransferase [Bacteroidales bacterium]